MEALIISAKDQRPEISSLKTETARSFVPVFDLEDLYCVLQSQPRNSSVALELAQRLCDSGRNEEARKILLSVVKFDSRFETVLALGLVEYKMNLDRDSIQHLHEALLISPGEGPQLFEIFKVLGNLFVRRRDYDLAEDSYNKAFRLDPNSDVLAVNIGTLHIQRADWDLAIQNFRTALGLNRDNDKAWVGLAIGHRMKGDKELSWGNIEAALECNPLNEVALTLVLDWGAEDLKEGRVLDLLRNFLVHGGWSEKMSLAFCWLSWKRGDTELAALELERIISVNPSNLKALDLLKQIRQTA